MVLVLLADGFEEIEALTPVDMLRRAGVTVMTVGMSGKTAHGAHGISVICDIMPENIELDTVDAVIFPGGMPGAKNLDSNPFSDAVINTVLARGGHIGAICAAPLVLGRRGVLAGKKAVCYPGFEEELRGADIADLPVVTDGNITTARGMGSALEFAEELVKILCGNEVAEQISKGIMKA